MDNPSNAVQGAVAPFGYPALGFLPVALIPKYKEFFVYTVDFNTIGPSASLVGTASIQADSDFVCVQQNATITNAAGTTMTTLANAPFLVSITDTGSGKQIQNAPVHINNWFGTGSQPYLLAPVPKIYKRSGLISVSLQNQDAANTFVVRFAFIGFKVYDVAA